ncbi:MAG: FecR domain-containing protein [Dissulfurispiraceae bacterium]|jgi:hypothetical protein
MNLFANQKISVRLMSGFVIMFLLLFFVVFLETIANASDESAGSLRKTKGDVLIERSGNIIKAEDGTPIYPNDTVKTGADSSVGIIFKDNSRIGLGPNSRLDIKKFVFKPAQGQFSMVNKLTKGTGSFVSGKMTKLSPESVIIETPTSSIGVRGTTYNIKVNDD